MHIQFFRGEIKPISKAFIDEAPFPTSSGRANKAADNNEFMGISKNE
jgi:hypothetical protein